nr:DUF2213 domain-containing protein [Pseudomonadota bacterium]
YNEANNGVYRGYFPPEVYTDPVGLESWNNVPVTLDHPNSEDGLVDLTNWEYEAVGDTGGKATYVDGGLENEFFIRSKTALAEIITGTTQLSLGAVSTIDVVAGETPEGEPYDFIFTEMRGNHVAIVQRGRIPGSRILTNSDGTDKLRVLVGNSAGQKANGKFVVTNSDGSPMELNTMSNRKESVMDKDKMVQITVANTDLTLDADNAKRVSAVFNSIEETHKADIATLNTTHETAIGALNEQITALNAEKEALIASTTPEALATSAADRVAVMNAADTLGIKLADVDTATTSALRLQVLNGSALPNAADYTSETPDAVAIPVFNTLVAMSDKPKVKNPLFGKTVANSGNDDTITDADAALRASYQNPESRQMKGN